MLSLLQKAIPTTYQPQEINNETFVHYRFDHDRSTRAAFYKGNTTDYQPSFVTIAVTLTTQPIHTKDKIMHKGLFSIDGENNNYSSVQLIASGYEWICPKCDTLNHEIETTETVECDECETTFEVEDYHHANG
jgi:hypothetical protein